MMKKVFVNGYGSIGSRIIQFLKDDPESIRLNTIVGDYYFEQGLYDIAANYYDQLLIIDDRNYDIYNSYGLSFLYQNNYALALDNFKKVIEFAPSYSYSYKYALSNIAETYIAMGNDNKAIDIYSIDEFLRYKNG